MRWAYWVMTIAGLGGCNDSCEIADVLARDVGDSTPTSCSPVDATKAALRAAHDCAVAANAAEQPFVLRWGAGFFDSSVEFAYFGHVHGGAWTITLYASYDETGGAVEGPLMTGSQDCTSLFDQGDRCGEYTDMCLTCVSPIPLTPQARCP